VQVRQGEREEVWDRLQNNVIKKGSWFGPPFDVQFYSEKHISSFLRLLRGVFCQFSFHQCQLFIIIHVWLTLYRLGSGRFVKCTKKQKRKVHKFGLSPPSEELIRFYGTVQVNFHIFSSLAVKKLRAMVVSLRLKSIG
jgi:hypothetical protein